MRWLVLILFVFASNLYADGNQPPSEDLDAGFEVDDRPLIRQLAAPTSDDRLVAIIECDNRGLLNKTLVNRLWKDWKYILIEVLEYTWPPAAEDLIKEMYNTTIKDQYYYNWAYVLYKWEKFQYLDKDYPICETIRDNFFENYINKSSQGFTFKDKYLYIIKREWMYNRFMSSEDSGIDNIDREIIQFFANKLVAPKTSVGIYLLELLNTGKIETINLPDTIMYDTDLGIAHPATVAAILLDRPDVAKKIHDKLKTMIRTIRYGINPSQIIIRDSTNDIVEVMLASPADAMKLLEALFQTRSSCDTKYIMHHPWFSKLRSDPKFKEWWHEVKISIELEDPDPSFEHVDYNR